MKIDLAQLTEGVQQVVALLDQESPFAIARDRRTDFRSKAEHLFRKLHDAADEVLTIGLLGGTGVGKSTIMNALAGAAISSTSHRRPHTDKILIYRHDAAQLPPTLRSKTGPRVEHTHQVDAIGKIVLCDLPDFDSLLGEHRRRVLQFLDCLDLLVWVSSPEKYADARFYEFLELVPKARRNFYFVLNKTDLLFQGCPPDQGYERLATVTGLFLRHLGRTGIEQPILFTISAEQARGESAKTSPWNQFPSFRQQVFQQRDIKEVTAIKAANLDIEVKRLIQAVQTELRDLNHLKQVLDDVRKGLQNRLSDWQETGRNAIDDWLSQDLTEAIVERLEDAGALIGPGRGIAGIRNQWRLQIERRNRPHLGPAIAEPHQIATIFAKQWDYLRNQVEHLVLRKDIPEHHADRLRRILAGTQDLDNLNSQFRQVVESHIRYTRTLRSSSFRAVQVFLYAVVFALFLLALGGPEPWRRTLTSPNAASFGELFFALLNRFFSPTGLAAMGSLTAVNLLFAFRFYRRYKKFLRGQAQKIIESIKAELATIWDNSRDTLPAELNQLSLDLEHRIQQASALGTREKGS